MLSKKQKIPREIVKKVISEGHKDYSELFLIKKLKNNLPYNRYVVVVSKKVSKTAVGRNQIKRKIKSGIKKTESENNGWDIVFLTSPAIKKADSIKIKDEIEKVIKKIS